MMVKKWFFSFMPTLLIITGCSRILPSPEKQDTKNSDKVALNQNRLKEKEEHEMLPHSDQGYYFNLNKPATSADERVFQSITLELASQSSSDLTLKSFVKELPPLGVEVRVSIEKPGHVFASKLEKCQSAPFEEIFKQYILLSIAIEPQDGEIVEFNARAKIEKLTQGSGLTLTPTNGNSRFKAAVKCSNPELESGDHPVKACHNLVMVISNPTEGPETLETHRAYLFRVPEFNYFPYNDLPLKMASSKTVLSLQKQWLSKEIYRDMCSVNSILTPDNLPEVFISQAQVIVETFIEYLNGRSGIESEEKNKIIKELKTETEVRIQRYQQNLAEFIESGHFKKSLVINLNHTKIEELNDLFQNLSKTLVTETESAVEYFKTTLPDSEGQL